MREQLAPTDGEAVRRVLAGDVEAYRFLVERYRLEFGRLAEALVGDPDAAADALQEAFIRAYGSLGRCRDPNGFRRWFYRIVVNQCHDARRRRPVLSLDGVDIPARETADGGLEESELACRLERALEALTPEQREVFVLKEIEDRSYGEIAELLGTTVDALRMRVHRARDVLKRLLEDAR